MVFSNEIKILSQWGVFSARGRKRRARRPRSQDNGNGAFGFVTRRPKRLAAEATVLGIV
jgi:hypothetical protein